MLSCHIIYLLGQISALPDIKSNVLNILTSKPNYVRTIEDDVEQQRQKKLDDLKAKGIKGTPVTEESFKLWQERKRKAKEDAARKLVETEMKKRKVSSPIKMSSLNFMM